MTSVVPIPVRSSLFPEPAGRPGDWWESLPGTTAAVAAPLRREAQRRRLPVDLLAALLIERALVGRDIADCAIDQGEARMRLSGAATVLATSGPGRLHTSYVRVLQTGERAYEHESEMQLDRRNLLVPLRLHDTTLALDVAEVCRSGPLDEAIKWEIAAATRAQFMREWALRTLLACSAPADGSR